MKRRGKIYVAAQCGCGAVVAHNLAKVRVASSNLVIRSDSRKGPPGNWRAFLRSRRAGQGNAAALATLKLMKSAHSRKSINFGSG